MVNTQFVQQVEAENKSSRTVRQPRSRPKAEGQKSRGREVQGGRRRGQVRGVLGEGSK
jgi:hypothetical protein